MSSSISLSALFLSPQLVSYIGCMSVQTRNGSMQMTNSLLESFRNGMSNFFQDSL